MRIIISLPFIPLFHSRRGVSPEMMETKMLIRGEKVNVKGEDVR